MVESTAELLDKYFDTAFDAPNGIAKLRELILTLAMQGKLVEQNPEDEPASVLLERIGEEKARLVKEGKIKKQKALPEIKVEEVPYELPEGWKWCRLGDVCNINGGYAFKSSKYQKQGIRVIRISDFDENGLKSDKIVRYKNSRDLDHFRLLKGHILMAMTGGTVGKTLFVNELEEPMVVNQRVATIQPVDKLLPNFINLFVNSRLVKGTISKVKNSTNDNISMIDILGFKLPLPPLPEQQRIVQRIDQLMARCDALESLREQRHQALLQTHRAALQGMISADAPEDFQRNWGFLSRNFEDLHGVKENVVELRKAVLQLGVMGKLVPQDPEDEPASVLLERIKAEKARLVKEGKIKKQKELAPVDASEVPFTVPSGWEWCRLGDCTKVITDGTHQTPKYTDEGRPFISAQCVKPFKFMPENCRYVSEEHYQGYIKNRKPELGDILLSRVGAGIGEAAVIDTDLEFAIYVSTGLIKVFDYAIDSKYLAIWLNSPLGRGFSEQFTYGKGASQGNLNLSLIRNFTFCFPPLNEQKKIVLRVEQLMTICDFLEDKIDGGEKVQGELLDAVMAGL